MPRKVFFSFHFGGDITRANNVRNAWRVGADHEASPIVDKAGWEQVKRGGDAAVKRWIDNAMNGCGVTCVLIGQSTFSRPWVHYEIAKSFLDGRGVLGVCLRDMKDWEQKSFSLPGRNPFEATKVSYQNRYNIPNYPIYSWVHDNGRANFGAWVERAARAAGR